MSNDNKIVVFVDFPRHGEIVLTRTAGDTYTSRSEELIDFFHAPDPSTPSLEAGKEYREALEKIKEQFQRPDTIFTRDKAIINIVNAALYEIPAIGKKWYENNEAVDFAEWVEGNYYRHTKLWYHLNVDLGDEQRIYGKIKSQGYRTMDLYKIFKGKALSENPSLPSKDSQQVEAIGFAEWKDKNAAMKDSDGKWIVTTFSGLNYKKAYTYQELYVAYLKQKEKQ